ncbi:MAG TPA: aminoacyl-tRNA hydrolase [Candidatus Paceibacterota bacterium]
MAWVIVGLGNPGEEYDATRHNAGRMALEHFAAAKDFTPLKEDKKNKVRVSRGMLKPVSAGRQGTLVALIAPDTYMNTSGTAVVKYVKSIKAAERMVVIYDDLDLPLGTIKISFDRGSGGHKGLESVTRAVRTKKFTRVRIGVSSSTASGALKKPPGEKEVLDFILSKFRSNEMEELKRVFKRVDYVLECIVIKGYLRAMNEFN